MFREYSHKHFGFMCGWSRTTLWMLMMTWPDRDQCGQVPWKAGFRYGECVKLSKADAYHWNIWRNQFHSNEVTKYASLDYEEVNHNNEIRDRQRSNSGGILEEHRVGQRRKYDPRYSYKVLYGKRFRSKQSEEIAQEFKRLGIGFCFEGNSTLPPRTIRTVYSLTLSCFISFPLKFFSLFQVSWEKVEKFERTQHLSLRRFWKLYLLRLR